MWRWLAWTLISADADPGEALRLAQQARLAGEDSRAVRLLERAVVTAPPDARVHAALARLYLERGEPPEAIAPWLVRARAIGGAEAQTEHLAGLAEDAAGRGWAAARAFERSLEADPGQSDARFRLAGLYLSLGDLLRAEHHYRVLARSRPDWLGVGLSLASVLEQQGRDADAIAELEALLVAQPGAPAVIRRLGELYERAGKSRRAERLRREGREDAKRPMRPLPPSRR